MTSFSVSQTVQTTVGPLTLDERVLYEPSAYQYDTGWWALDADSKEYFVSDQGIVYTNSEHPYVYDVSCGKVLS